MDFNLESRSDNENENGEDGDGGFDMNGDEDGAMEEEDERLPVLTRDVIKGWQKAILEVSLVSFLPSFSFLFALHSFCRANLNTMNSTAPSEPSGSCS